MKSKFLLFLILALATSIFSGCGTVAKLAESNERCVVIARRAQIRSSDAVVAADLLEIERGATLEILGDDTYEGEKWYNVRATDENNTEGWIEARNVLPNKLLEQSKKLAEQDKDIPAQASGQLRNASNLRITPGRNNDDNIMQKLLSGDTFEIVGWQRIPKPADADSDDKDDQPKAAANKQNKTQRQKHKEGEEVLRLDDKYDTWYKVRLNSSVSPAPAGWIYGKQVELTVPADIIFYRTGREFVAWKRIDGEQDTSVTSYSQGKDAGKESKPGSWVILERSSRIEEPNGDEPDFDHIRIIGYDKPNQDHYKVYVSGMVKGFLPLRVNGSGDSRAFTVRIKGADGQIREMTFTTFKDARGLVKVTVPPDIPKENKNDN
ncbi:MAG: hypothetical protein ABI954_14585 [Pyrinomonadaceae bacterium]